jgi:hypothetical protein
VAVGAAAGDGEGGGGRGEGFVAEQPAEGLHSGGTSG